ncbi:RtcB family protein [Georgenia thermotolerans]|uniref:3'-phosphate/5'-hydroxy nucleic acid ligase n=1 Tax=Georgenia thermotolerans TaxID=527326 RepID=A0A7J5UUX7_9MICO|nr:RtcB family protein [Georgenia thermotolerans]KAE8766076.1 RtcB family protein [Georgenia thermotolerans]
MQQISDKLYSWASVVDEETLEQARLTATMPFVHPHVALMPDAHVGLGATVGSVIPTVGAVMPAAVGVDIGCGMVAVRTQFTAEQVRGVGRPLAQLREQIEHAVPLSAGRYNRKVRGTATAAVGQLEQLARESDVAPANFGKNWRLQLGSLGGGNHFIEISDDEQGGVWVFLHSGSRGVGNHIARRFIDRAKHLARSRGIHLPHRDLAYLPDDDPAFHDYLAHLHWAQEFARLNREVMKERVIDELARFMDADVERVEEVNAHHNYTATETHFGTEVLVSRKGAVDAHAGVRGLIPGSMGTASYVVTGKGNAMALCSAPHGAGRVYSRARARKTFTQDDLRRRMTGIEYRDLPDFIDEIPDAYKDIDVVMADAADLVSVDHVLHQLLNVKGQ